MNRRVIFLLTLLVACGTAQASEWVSLGKNDSGKAEVFVDVTTIKVTGPIRLVWVKAAAAHHTEKGVGTDKGKWVTYYLTRFSFDCDDGTSLIEGGMIYFDDGTNTTLPAAAFSASWEPVAPDTGMHTIMDFTCSWKPTTQTGDPPSQNGDPHLSDVDRSTPAQDARTIQMPDCGKDYYPSQASRLHQQGVAVVRVCIGMDNKIDGPVELVRSSGFPLLDEAAAKCVAAGRYKAATINGVPAATCREMSVNFTRD